MVSSDSRHDLLGQLIGGKYRVLSVLGEGGMGVVFEVELAGTGRSFALKVLNPTQAKRGVAVQRFYQEARAASGIRHPNICAVYDLGTLPDESPYMVMERLYGRALSDRIAKMGSLPILESLSIARQVLSGLDAAHRIGVIHRDIKPENVFLCDVKEEGGEFPLAKIVDFGVSKMVPSMGASQGEELNLTRTGMVMGTPYYMSPEQARGERTLDARVDVYATGVLLYEALAGRRPFIAPNYNALLMQILSTAPRSLREFRDDMPTEVERLVEKAMRRSRETRYQTAAAFLADTRAIEKIVRYGTTNSDVTQFNPGSAIETANRFASKPYPAPPPPPSSRPVNIHPPMPIHPPIPPAGAPSQRSYPPPSSYAKAPATISHARAPIPAAPSRGHAPHQVVVPTKKKIDNLMDELDDTSTTAQLKRPAIDVEPGSDFDDAETALHTSSEEQEREERMAGFESDGGRTEVRGDVLKTLREMQKNADKKKPKR